MNESESRIELTERLRREGRWSEASQFKDQVLRGLREQGMKRNEAGDEAWRQMAEQYPALPEADVVVSSSRVQGLSSIPVDWPSLPANASLQSEIAWVQASRLDVVEDTPAGGTRVDLSRADSPAPSKAAIGWLETSIRAYSKYCDIAAKATAQQEHEAEAVRREKLAIAEIRDLLSEMRPDE